MPEEVQKPNIATEEITKVYVGGNYVCRCGCAGKYFNRGEKGFESRANRFIRLWKDYEPAFEDVGYNYRNISTAAPRGKYGTGRAITAYINE